MDAAGQQPPTVDVCVLGAGLAGLTAARDLAAAGRRVVVLEAAPEIGGLAASVDVHGVPVERFYHFICRGDDDLMALVAELGLGDSVHWQASRTAFFHHGRHYPFVTPLDLLRFSPVPLLQRLRFGLNVLRSRYRRHWRELDRVAAVDWLVGQIGPTAYDVIWDPLLRIKFGDAHRQVSAAWIWHRIHRIAASRRRPWQPEQLGTLDNGSATVVEALAADLRQRPGVSLRTAARVVRIETEAGRVSGVRLADGSRMACRAVLSTAALPALLDMAPDLPAGERRLLESVDYLGVVCILLVLRRSLTPCFWLNVNDPAISFNGVIEYSNLNRRVAGRSIVYVPYYLRTSHPRFGWDDGRILDEVVAGLGRIRPDFDRSWVESSVVSRARHAQAVCTVGFAERVPGHRSALAGLYLTDSAQFYPEDRTISATIRLGRATAAAIDAEL